MQLLCFQDPQGRGRVINEEVNNRPFMKTAAIGAPRPKSRSGCLGCLSQVVVVLLLGSILVLAIPAVFSPWAPDGRVNLGSLPAVRENIPITMVEGSWSDFQNACAANH